MPLLISVLVFFPALYWVNSEMPWTKSLFARGDRTHRAPFLASLGILNLATCVASILWWLAMGRTVAEIGVDVSKLSAATLILAVAGLLIASLKPKTASPSAGGDPKGSRAVTNLIAPATLGERRGWVFVCLVAGVCEEIIYRAIAISLLREAGLNVGYAIVISALSFAAMHGRSVLAISALVQHLVSGIVFGVVYVWTGSLLTVVALHTAWNLLLLLRPVEPQPAA